MKRNFVISKNICRRKCRDKRTPDLCYLPFFALRWQENAELYPVYFDWFGITARYAIPVFIAKHSFTWIHGLLTDSLLLWIWEMARELRDRKQKKWQKHDRTIESAERLGRDVKLGFSDLRLLFLSEIAIVKPLACSSVYTTTARTKYALTGRRSDAKTFVARAVGVSEGTG